MKRIPAVLLLCLATFVIGGCSENKDEKTVGPRVIVEDGEYSDQRFIDMMAPHHQMGIDMAAAALDQSQGPDILALSEKIVRGQTNEIEEMKRLHEELYGSRETPDQMHPEMMDNMGMSEEFHTASGHQAPAEDHANHEGTEEADAQASSDDFDKQFLDNMIPHHAAAVQAASLVLVHSDNYKLRVMAREIVDEQSREIGMMGDWRVKRWPHEF